MSNLNDTFLKPTEIYLAIMSDLDTDCLTVELINKKVADECLDHLILNVINTKRKKKKRADASSIYGFIYKELKKF